MNKDIDKVQANQNKPSEVPAVSKMADDVTETIDFGQLSLEKLSTSGSFVVPGVSSSAIGKLLDSLPLPVLLLDDSLSILFLNSAWGKLGSGYRDIEGWPGHALFPAPAAAHKARELMEEVLANRKPRVAEGLIRIEHETMWGRMHFRSLRISGVRFVLMIVEDLTAQRRQIELKNKMEAELRESQGRLQELVLLRTSDLSKSNENLRAEIEERKRFQNKLFRALQKLETTLMSTVVALASMTEKKDPHTAGHQRRVSQLANAIATEMRLPKSKSAATKISAALHDIGKIYIPAEFLSKPGTITELEREIIREHPRVGYEILREVDFVWPVAEIVYQHHERMDGSGYPRSLRGEEILMEARILAVADVVEAMVSHRPYRQALSEEQALREIKSNSGTVYDDEVAAACLSVFGSGFAFS